MKLENLKADEIEGKIKKKKSNDKCDLLQHFKTL